MEVKYTGSLSDPGRFREQNQDASYVYRGQSGSFALALAADGVGSYKRSQVASSYMAECLEDFARSEAEELLTEGFSALREELCLLVETAHNDLVEASEEAGHRWGTTVTLLAVCEDAYFCVQIGDSRLYLSEGGQTRQITEDQTVGQRKRRQGQTDITAKEDNTLLQCVGIGGIDPEFYQGRVEGPASFLVCSDGLSNTISAEEFEEVLSAENLSGDEKLRVLDERARSRGEKDNITGVLVEIG